MATVTHHQMKQGLKVILDNDPCTIVGADFIKPGKGQAFTRVKMRNLLTGRILEKTYKSSDSLELADVVDTSMQYLYTDGEMWHFMNPENYEQIGASLAAMGGTEKWLKEEDICQVVLWNGRPIAIEAPNFVYLKVAQTDPGLRGDTSSGGSKPATLETGAVVNVPLFINEGDLLKIDTRTGEYSSRAKE